MKLTPGHTDLKYSSKFTLAAKALPRCRFESHPRQF
jgi:hypothetical protein